MKFLDKFKIALERHSCVSLGARIFVACSGGPDSVALFHLLRSLRTKWKLKIGLIHVHHGLRRASAQRDARFVRSLAKEFGIPYCTRRVSVHEVARRNRASVEEAAREVRYKAFDEMTRSFKRPVILTAHTQNDQAETVLMRVLQGTGLRGLSGIRPDLRKGRVRYVRPLLGFAKSELMQYLRTHRFRFCRDPSNRSLRFIRNRIRNRLFPQLSREFNPRVIECIARIPAIVNQENELLGELEREAWKRTFKTRTARKLRLDRKVFLKFPAPLKYRLLERALKKLDNRSGLSFDAWMRICPQLDLPYYRCTLPRDIDFSVTPLKIELCKNNKADPKGRSCSI